MLERRGCPDFFEELSFDEPAEGELRSLFAVPGMPNLPALKSRWAAGEATRVLHPLWPSTPEPGIVEMLQEACSARAAAGRVEVRAGRRARGARTRKARA